MERSTDEMSQPPMRPHTASITSTSEGLLSNSESSLRDPELYSEMESPGASSVGASFNGHGSATQFNVPRGTQNNNTSNGYQFPEARFLGPVSFQQMVGEPSEPLQDCLRSLAFPEMDSRLNSIATPAKGTCEWLFRHKMYSNWSNYDREILWIRGKPGSGKSTLLRFALDSGRSMLGIGDDALMLSFFFHDRGNEFQKTPVGLFRSLLHQILRQVPSALQDFVDIFEQKRKDTGESDKKRKWHPNELQRFFKSSLQKVLNMRPVCLYIDALDESGKENAVALVQEFKTLAQELPPTRFRLLFCFACREYPIPSQNGEFEIYLQRENEDDISTYVRAQLSGYRAPGASKILRLITERANGVFMWARLVVTLILSPDNEGRTFKEIKRRIKSTPPELDELYSKLVQDMDDQSESLKLIRWVCFSIRPLSLDELRWAMVLDADSPQESLQQCQSAEEFVCDSYWMEKRLNTLSRGLVEAVPSSKSRIVQFIHQSVKDYFVEKGLKALDADLHSTTLAVESGHYYLSRSCIRYLAMEEIVRSITAGRQNLRSEFPLLHYATTSWVKHAKQSEAKQGTSLLDCFAWPSQHLVQAWVRIYSEIDEYSANHPPKGTTLLHIVSKHALIQPLSLILQNSDRLGAKIDCLDANDRTPLSWAAEEGHEAVAKLLLETGKVDINTEDKYGRTPLWCAAGNGHEAVIQLLLDTEKADVDSKDKYDQTPLSRAAQNGHEAVVKLLVSSRNVDINSKDNNHRTPIWWAAGNGHEAVVKFLLTIEGLDINATDIYHRTPVWWAVEKEHEAVIKLLLDSRKVDVNVKDIAHDRTALRWIAEKGHEAIVKLLLDAENIDVNAKDKYGRTPLWCAAANGHEAVVNLLLASEKADINVRDKDVQTPLLWASRMGKEPIVEFLLTIESLDINAEDMYCWTPLLWAAENGHRAIVKLLLAREEVNVDVKDSYGRTPLWWAAEKGHKAVVKLLLATGKADVNTKDKYGRTPVWWASEKGYEGVVELLLNTGKVDVNVKDKYGRTPLWWAAGKGYEAVVGLLLATGKVDVNAEDRHGRTPLWWAAGCGHEAVVKLLLATKKVDVSVKDKYGRTPGRWAREKGHEGIVNLLHA